MRGSRVMLRTTFLSAWLLGIAWMQPAAAWWDTGHMVTAQIAYDGLRPDVRVQADRLIALLNVAEPDPARQAFVPASVWMDALKERGLTAFNEWHYSNIPYNPEGLPTVPAAKEVNVVERIDSMIHTLQAKTSSPFEQAFALRVLVHLVGDVHQPYHVIGKVSHQYPHGDLGGNLTPVHQGSFKNIHAFWDSTAGLFPQINPSDWQSAIPAFAARLEALWPRARFETRLRTPPVRWAEESYALAVHDGYEALPANGVLSPAYIAKAQAICAERLALGGYRLAEVLNAVL